MRSLLQIIIAVKDQTSVTEEELKLAVIALSGMETMDQRALRDLAEKIIEGSPIAKMKASFILRESEIRFKSKKMPVDKYLGPSNIPGTPENDKFVRMAKNIFKKATGEDL